jgi:predicted transcriptional regulator
MKQISLIISLFLIFSCNKVGVSKTEVQAVDKVLEFYGGEINRSIGFKTANAKKTDYFELKISKSQLLNNDQKDLTEHAGNIAYLFYSNLKNEKSNYDEIKVIIDLQNGESRSYNFPVNELKEIEALYQEIEKTNNSINNSDFKFLANQFDERIGTNEIELEKLLSQLHSNFGSIKQIQFQGFQFSNDKDMGDYIIVKEAIVLENDSIAMYLSYDRNTKKLIGIHFP